jgi:hypothetical protein
MFSQSHAFTAHRFNHLRVRRGEPHHGGRLRRRHHRRMARVIEHKGDNGARAACAGDLDKLDGESR